MADVKSVCAELAQAAQLLTDPRTPKSQRIEAFQKCEQFKETSPIIIECAFVLINDSVSNPDRLIVRIFGLKILEDSIKLRWNLITPEHKLFIKENVMRLMESGTGDILKEVTHIKDGISRCVVEIIKREWPQHWPSLLSELDQLCVKGETQTELVMFVILRLVEDVAVLQTLEQTQRRKEIYHGLTSKMEDIFSFLLGLLEKHYKAYIHLSSTSEPGDTAKRQVKVCKAVLNTFNAFVEWVPMSHIIANDKYLIRCLCHLLSDSSLQLYAGECLLNIVSTKQGKIQDKMQLLSLFETDMITPLFAATEAAEKKSAQEENHYIFLKKMVQILVELGSQLCGIWSTKENKSARPQNFDIYLNALLFFTRHPSLNVNLLANELWNKFYRHAEISQDELFRSYVTKWIEAALKKVAKVGLHSDSPCSAYSIQDFETDDEYNSFFGRYRIIILEGVKLVSSTYSPLLAFGFTENWLRTILNTPMTQPLTTTSPIYLQIEAISTILEAVLSKSDLHLPPILSPTLGLLKLTLDYHTNDPLLLSVLLSCISSMFVAVTLTPEALQPVMNKIFSCITFTDTGKQPTVLSPEAVILRRHGCSLLVKICTKYASTLRPIFDHLRDTIVELHRNELIGKMEFSSLVEALVLVSNEFKNYSMQVAFLESISVFTVDQFKALEAIIQSPDTFIDFIGLDKCGDDVAANDKSNPYYVNRTKISFCTIFLLSICRRAQVPADLQDCRTGGFVLHEVDGVVSLRNPAAGVANAVLPLVLNLAKTFNTLWRPENLSKYGYGKALEMLDAEKVSVTGNNDFASESKEKTTRDRMKCFISETFENIYHFLGEYCVSFGIEFYQVPGLSDALVTFILSGIPVVPDYRLRSVMKNLVKNLINKCPKRSYSEVLAPILQNLCPYMLERLTNRWKYLESIREASNFDEDNRNSQEVIEDVIIRNLTREYLDVIKAMLTSGGGSDVKIMDNTDCGSNNNGGSSNQLSLSELGTLVLFNDSLRHCVLLTLLRSLVWQDSNSSVRACNLLELVLPALAQSGKLGPDEARQVMISILSAIHDLGQHELNNIALTQLAIQAYEWMRPLHPSIVQVLAQVPGCNQEDLKRFDERMLSAINGKENMKGGDRVKKDMFKKIINQFIGKDIAQMFKKEVVIKNLPTLHTLKTRHKTPNLDEIEHNDIGLNSLFNGSK